MEVIAKLQFGDNFEKAYHQTYQVVGYHSLVSRRHNSFHPYTVPQCDVIELTVVAPDKSDMGLYQWYLDNEKRSGCISLDLQEVKANEDSSVEHMLEFEDAQCFAIEEDYNVLNHSLRLFTLKVCVANFSFDGICFGLEANT